MSKGRTSAESSFRMLGSAMQQKSRRKIRASLAFVLYEEQRQGAATALVSLCLSYSVELRASNGNPCRAEKKGLRWRAAGWLTRSLATWGERVGFCWLVGSSAPNLEARLSSRVRAASCGSRHDKQICCSRTRREEASYRDLYSFYPS